MSEANLIERTVMQRLHVLQHSLGLNQYGQGAGHRNYFVTSEGTTDWPVCVAAVAEGLMTQTKGNAITGGGDVFRVTPEGVAWVQQHSPKAPTLTRGQRAYRAWLNADNDMTFGQWLKSGRSKSAA
jgi:hypothetical protein